MAILDTDAILWYNNGAFGQAGYAVPNFSNDVSTVNNTIQELVDICGQALFAIMHTEDVNLYSSPSINRCLEIHKLYKRCAQILKARAKGPSEIQFESSHNSPAQFVFRVYPVPYHLVRNPELKRWAGWILKMLANMMQHEENAKQEEVTTAFASEMGDHFQRVYYNMATELFGIDPELAKARDFFLKDEDFAKYDPSQFKVGTERINTVAPQQFIFTEDMLRVLRQGLPCTSLPNLTPWPTNFTQYATNNANTPTAVDWAAGTTASASASVASAGFPKV